MLLQGPDAARVLGHISGRDVDILPGHAVYTQWLNARGGIEADLTVTRIDDDQFLIVTSAASQARDYYWLREHIPDDACAVVTDVTSGYAVIALMGPRSRTLLRELTPEDLSSAAFPFGASREIELGYARVRATRMSYVGELGCCLLYTSPSPRD